MSKEIILTNSDKRAIVDDEDYEFVNQFTWQLENGYAVTYDFGKRIEMGSLVMQRSSSKSN
ncbi:MAG TPA: hypothetical protein VGE97_07580 [Nitrososphaera sp.]|jgi:hypothetical protein